MAASSVFVYLIGIFYTLLNNVDGIKIKFNL
jgi:hypothetical protein